MKFVFEIDRSETQQKMMSARYLQGWDPLDIFPKGLVSSYSNETSRKKWADVFLSLSFGEATAFYGFPKRINSTQEISSKNWLIYHLADEARHVEGFSRFLKYFYPSWEGTYEGRFKNRYAYLFYGLTHKTDSLVEWLTCTQIAEIYGKHCYKNLFNALSKDPHAALFFRKIIEDEQKHIVYINEIINSLFSPSKKCHGASNIYSHISQMNKLARDMFEGKRNSPMFRAFSELEIDVTAFCDQAQDEILKKWQVKFE